MFFFRGPPPSRRALAACEATVLFFKPSAVAMTPLYMLVSTIFCCGAQLLRSQGGPSPLFLVVCVFISVLGRRCGRFFVRREHTALRPRAQNAADQPHWGRFLALTRARFGAKIGEQLYSPYPILSRPQNARSGPFDHFSPIDSRPWHRHDLTLSSLHPSRSSTSTGGGGIGSTGETQKWTGMFPRSSQTGANGSNLFTVAVLCRQKLSRDCFRGYYPECWGALLVRPGLGALRPMLRRPGGRGGRPLPSFGPTAHCPGPLFISLPTQWVKTQEVSAHAPGCAHTWRAWQGGLAGRCAPGVPHQLVRARMLRRRGDGEPIWHLGRALAPPRTASQAPPTPAPAATRA